MILSKNALNSHSLSDVGFTKLIFEAFDNDLIVNRKNEYTVFDGEYILQSSRINRNRRFQSIQIVNKNNKLFS